MICGQSFAWLAIRIDLQLFSLFLRPPLLLCCYLFFLPQIELIGGLIFIVKLFRWTRRKAFKRSRRKNLLKSDEFKQYMLCEPQYDNILLSRFSSICEPDNADGCTFRS